MKQPNTLIQAAVTVRQNAHAPYSGFTVGAAVECVDGSIFSGANVENASYGLTVCAERTALASAISAGQREFRQLVIVSSNGVTPCGACRQVIWELCGNIPILLVDENGQVAQTSSGQLLPSAFSSDNLQS